MSGEGVDRGGELIGGGLECDTLAVESVGGWEVMSVVRIFRTW
jgi:hypothetical protein